MYGLVLVTAMAAGQDVAPPPHPAPVAPPIASVGCGVVVNGYGCYGSCYGVGGGCYGSCHGRMSHGHRAGGGLFGHHRASCHGCTGYSCNGWNCFGSCHGYRTGSGCCGGYGFGTLQGTPWQCHGGCSGGSCYGYTSAWGLGPAAMYSDPYAVYGRVNMPPMIVVPPEGGKPMETPVAPPPKPGMGANLKFRVPADAKLYVDGRLTTVGGTERSFTTPALAPGQKYYYDVRAEMTVGDKLVVEEKRVIVEAGAKVSESFEVLIAAAERKAAPVAGRE